MKCEASVKKRVDYIDIYSCWYSVNGYGTHWIWQGV